VTMGRHLVANGPRETDPHPAVAQVAPVGIDAQASWQPRALRRRMVEAQ
jgi:hypothetical protein